MRRTLTVMILLPLLTLGTMGHGQVYDDQDGAFANGILTENDDGFYEDAGLYGDEDEFGFEDDEFGFEDDELGLEGDRFGFDAGYAPYDDEYGVYDDDLYGGYGVYDYDDLYEVGDEFGLDERYWDEYLTADDFDMCTTAGTTATRGKPTTRRSSRCTATARTRQATTTGSTSRFTSECADFHRPAGARRAARDRSAEHPIQLSEACLSREGVRSCGKQPCAPLRCCSSRPAVPPSPNNNDKETSGGQMPKVARPRCNGLRGNWLEVGR